MLSPLRNNTARVQTSITSSVPAPVGGWDAKNGLASMPQENAIRLDNVFPDLTEVRLRRGFQEYATGIGSGDVESLMEYSGPGGSQFFAAGNNAIYDISGAGAASSAVTGLSSTRFQHTMFSTSGGNFLWICNGVDDPRYFDGTSWSTPSLTGVPPGSIAGVAAHQRRLFFALNDSLKFGYLPLLSIAGGVSEFDLAPIFDKGGFLQAIGSWTRDGGAGMDDVACFITSEGQVAVFSGSDPGSFADWALTGVFNIGKPLGRRCVFKVGSELVVITEDGYVPLSAILPIERVNIQGQALSDRIRNAVKEAAQAHGANFGWQCIFYPKGSYALFNVPVSSTTAQQHVVNTQTGAWCRFTGQHARCWGLYRGDLYFGGTDGRVMKADAGVSDDGTAIAGAVKPAFNYFGRRSGLKRFRMMRPLIESNGSIPVATNWNVDFEDVAPTSVPTAPEVTGALWDSAQWDVDVWAPGKQLVNPWISINGIGYAGTPSIAIMTSTLTFALKAFDVMYEAGGVM